MAAKPKSDFLIDTNERQREYVAQQKTKGDGLGIVFADAFIRGMRDLGYKSPGWAMAEMIDNAIQAAATAVEIRVRPETGGRAKPENVKPEMLAIVDNGAGMIPDMISYSVRWGGTDREDNRQGFGRFGYGLPSSAVSLAKRYVVYSKIADGEWHKVTVDLDQLARIGNDVKATIEHLTPERERPPAWIKDTKGKINVEKLKSGTVILLENLDRLRKQTGWITVGPLTTKLLQHFGVIYRHWFDRVEISVDGIRTEPVDPLFLMENARFFDETEVRARRVVTTTGVTIESERGRKAQVRIRASYLPANFQLVNPMEYGQKGARNNRRFDVMRAYNGLLICREGRQIDCITPDWTKFQNYDMNVKIEIDFDPELDEYFGLTTAKQQIVIDDHLWERLKQPSKDFDGLIKLVKDIRKARDDNQDQLAADMLSSATPETPRPSELAMEAAEQYRTRTPTPAPEKVKVAKRNLEDAAKEHAQKTGQSTHEAFAELSNHTAKRRWEVEFRAIEDGPFYIPKRLGEQKRLIINTAHPFYPKVYDQAPAVRSALEVLLFVLADGEIEAADEKERFYQTERRAWSENLRNALDMLIDDIDTANRSSATMEQSVALN